MNKKIYIIIIIVLLLTFVLYGCNEKESYKIGFIATLSGSNSGVGIAVRDGLLLKVDEINRNGGLNGREVEVLIRDDKGDLSIIVSKDQELIDQGVEVIFGHELSSKSQQLLESARNNDNVLFVTPTISSDEIMGLDDNIFKTSASAFEDGEVLGAYTDKYSKSTLVVYTVNNGEYAKQFYDGYDFKFSGELEYYPVEENIANDSDAIVEKYKKGNFDSVLYITNSHDLMYMSQIFHVNDMYPKIYSSGWGIATNNFDEGGQLLEGALFVTITGELNSQKYFKFVDEYELKYKKAPDSAATFSYETADILFDALESSEKLEFDYIKASMLNMKDIETIITNLHFDEYGDVKRKSFIMQLENDKFILKK